jgi:hypothetical protein
MQLLAKNRDVLISALLIAIFCGFPSIIWNNYQPIFYADQNFLTSLNFDFDGPRLFGLVIVTFLYAAITVQFALWAGNRNGIKSVLAPRYGVVTALKHLISGSILCCLFLGDGSERLDIETSIVGIFVVILPAFWTALDMRPPSTLRIVCLTGLALIALKATMVNFQGGTHDLLVLWEDDKRPKVSPLLAEVAFSIVSAFFVLLTTFVGFLTGLICAKKLPSLDRPPTSLTMFSNWSKRWLRGDQLSLKQLVTGLVSALVLTALLCAQNTSLFRDGLNWQTLHVAFSFYPAAPDVHNRLSLILVSFDLDAMRSILLGLKSVSPFLLAGSGLIWLANRFRLTGILPILAIGAAMGGLWSATITSLYATPYLDFHGAATLLGMIVAAAFGAGTNLFAVPSAHDNDGAPDELVTKAK